MWFHIFDLSRWFVVWATHSSSSLCSPAQRISTMAPVPKKVIGVSATTKTARKARPSHHKGVSFNRWRVNLRGGCFGGADGLHLLMLALWSPRWDGPGLLIGVVLGYRSGWSESPFNSLVGRERAYIIFCFGYLSNKRR